MLRVTTLSYIHSVIGIKCAGQNICNTDSVKRKNAELTIFSKFAFEADQLRPAVWTAEPAKVPYIPGPPPICAMTEAPEFVATLARAAKSRQK
jgi:hypothetical protein